MAFKKLKSALDPNKPKPSAPSAPTGASPGSANEYSGPKSSMEARNGYAKAMNAGDRAAAARYKAQMDAEEAAAKNVVPSITRR